MKDCRAGRFQGRLCEGSPQSRMTAPSRGCHTPEQAALGLSQADRQTIILAELKPADQLQWWQIAFHGGAGGYSVLGGPFLTRREEP